MSCLLDCLKLYCFSFTFSARQLVVERDWRCYGIGEKWRIYYLKFLVLPACYYFSFFSPFLNFININLIIFFSFVSHFFSTPLCLQHDLTFSFFFLVKKESDSTNMHVDAFYFYSWINLFWIILPFYQLFIIIYNVY